MAGRERRVERGRMAVCAFVLTLSVLIAGGVYLTASPGDSASDAGLAPQSALTADAAHAPDVAAAPGVSGVGEASTAPVAPEPGAPDAMASAPMGSAYTTDADVPVQVYGGEEPGNSDQATGYIVSQNDPAAPQSPTGTGDQTGTARGLDVRVTSPQTSIDESSPSHSSTGQSANAYDAVNGSTGAAYAQDGTNANDHGSAYQGSSTYAEDEDRAAYAPARDTSSSSVATYVEPTPSVTLTEGVDYVSGTVLINVEEGMSANQVADSLASAGVQSVDPSTVNLVTDSIAEVSVTAGNSVEDALAEVAQADAVTVAQPNFIYHIEQEHSVRELKETLLLDDLTSMGPAYDEANLMLETQQEQATDQDENTDVIDATDAADNAEGIDDAASQDTSASNGGLLDTQSEDVTSEDAYGQTTEDLLTTESERTEGVYTTQSEAAFTATQDTTGSTVSESVETAAVPTDQTEQAGQDNQQTQAEVEGEAKQGAEAQTTDQEGVAKPEELLETLSLKPVVNDTYYAMQWGIESIDADEAWDANVKSDYKVGVAVFDNGFNVNHEDLKDAIKLPYNALTGSADVSNPNINVDKNHGMHVLGIVGAVANNEKGVAGVSHNAWVVPVLVSNSTGNTSTTDIVTAYDYVMKHQGEYNIRVVCMSLGMRVDTLSTDYSLFESVDKAFNSGIVTVCSAGNNASSSYINLPSDYAPIVSVINLENTTVKGNINSSLVDLKYTDAYDVRRNNGSNFNKPGEMNKDISAPGTYILSAYKETRNVGTDKNVPYGSLSGTSMAAPHVAGVLALMFSNRTYPKSAEGSQQAVDTLLSTARSLYGTGFDNGTGFGEVNALNAVNADPGALIDGPTYVGVEGGSVSYQTSGGGLSSSDSSVLEITSSGQATPKAAGQVLLSSSTGRKAVTVVGPIEGSNYVKPGEAAIFTLAGSPLRWEWTASPSSLAEFTNIDPNPSAGKNTYMNGVLQAKNKTGIVTITATLQTPNPGGSQLSFTKEIQIGEPIVAKSTRLLIGRTVDIAKQESLTDASTYTWTTSNSSVATVNSSGVITAVGDGTAKVLAKNGDFIALEVSVTVDGNLEKRDGSDYVFTVSQPTDEVYSAGKAFEPDVTVTYAKDGTKLSRGRDYGLRYADNTQVGTATVTVTGMSPFTGTRTVTFKIAKGSINDATVSGVEDATYTGSAITQKNLKVTLKDGTELAKSDYTVSYSDNVNAGKASFAITAAGNYTGTKAGTFTIKPADASAAEVTGVVDKDYTGSPATQNPQVTVGGRTLRKDIDYTLSYRNNTEPGEATVTVTFTKNYSGDPISQTFEIKASLANATISEIPDQVFDNDREIKPEPTVRLGSKTLRKGTDYDLVYKDNTEVGTATVTAVGKEPYVGEKSQTFKIAEASIKDATIEGIESMSYTGERITQRGMRVTLNGKELREGADYTVDYDDNEDVGTATFTITAVANGNYTGSKRGQFEITPADASMATVSGLSTATYTGSAITQTPTVRLGNVTLEEDDDYEVATTNNVNVGNAVVTITYMDNYTGETKASFEITPASIEGAYVSAIGEQSYTGSAVEPRPTVTLNGKTLVEGTDYTLSYSNQVSPGTATVTVQGINNYTGTRTQSFEIVNPITKADVTLPAVVDYTGDAVIPKPTVVVDGRTLEEGKDYVLVYNNNVEKGIATLTIQGIGEFEGTSKTVTFEIKELSQDGWSDNSSGQQYYVHNNCIATGWQRIGNNVFWLGPNGLMQTGVYNNVVGNNRMRYYFSPSGALTRVRWTDPYQTYYATPYGNRLWMGSNGMCYRMNFNNGLLVPAYQYNPLSRYGRLFSNGLRSMPYQTMNRVMRSAWGSPYIAY